jgi:uncharacterized protein YjbI with pentapeptide repeats
MASDEHVALLKQGVTTWNTWHRGNTWHLRPDLGGASLTGMDLTGAHLHNVNLSMANLRGAKLIEAMHWGGPHRRGPQQGGPQLREPQGATLIEANLRGAKLGEADFFKADLRKAKLIEVNLTGTDLSEADLSGTDLRRVDLRGVKLIEVNLSGADLSEADLRGAYISGANLKGAKLGMANLSRANLRGADLSEADLRGAVLVGTDLAGGDLTGCRVYGASAWDLKLDGAKQQNLVITQPSIPEITIDNIEVAQFIYLLLHNQKIRDVINTITSKSVLILGRFTNERMAVLQALREELRNRNLLPILFDFAIPASRDVTETIKTLASLARFVIADVTDATEVRVELHNIAPDFTSLPIQLILLRGHAEFVSLSHLRKFPWVLPIFEYDDQEHLLTCLDKNIVSPAEDAARKLRS